MYLDQFQLSNDSDFISRCWAALSSEAVLKPDDPVSVYLLPDPYLGVKIFMPWLSAAPGFADAYATGGSAAIPDADLLAAIQASWPRVTVPA